MRLYVTADTLVQKIVRNALQSVGLTQIPAELVAEHILEAERRTLEDMDTLLRGSCSSCAHVPGDCPGWRGSPTTLSGVVRHPCDKHAPREEP